MDPLSSTRTNSTCRYRNKNKICYLNPEIAHYNIHSSNFIEMIVSALILYVSCTEPSPSTGEK